MPNLMLVILSENSSSINYDKCINRWLFGYNKLILILFFEDYNSDKEIHLFQ